MLESSGVSSALEKQKQVRGYEKWEGNNTIWCEGRIVGGPQRKNYYYTMGLIIVPSIIFFAGVAPPLISEHNLWYTVLIQIILVLTALISLTVTTFSDPGIIPRGIFPSEQTWRGPDQARQYLNMAGKIIEIKWCATCRIFRPPRSFHCSICNNCVERFDHHCPWVGNCIGMRNYPAFSVFTNSTQLLCFWSLGCCIYVMKEAGQSSDNGDGVAKMWRAIRKEPMALVASIYVFVAMWFVVTLVFFHCYLVCVGKTTNEELRHMFRESNPYSRGCIGNMSDMCCQIPQSQLHLYHVQPSTRENEQIVNKQKVVFLSSQQVADQSHILTQSQLTNRGGVDIEMNRAHNDSNDDDDNDESIGIERGDDAAEVLEIDEDSMDGDDAMCDADNRVDGAMKSGEDEKGRMILTPLRVPSITRETDESSITPIPHNVPTMISTISESPIADTTVHNEEDSDGDRDGRQLNNDDSTITTMPPNVSQDS